MVENIMAKDLSFTERDNIIYHDCYMAVRCLGEAIQDINPPKGVYVLDCGTDVDSAKNSDLIIYVVSSRLFKSNEIDDIASSSNAIVTVNPKSVKVGVDIAKMLGKRVYSFPLDSDAFSITDEKSKVLCGIIRPLGLDNAKPFGLIARICRMIKIKLGVNCESKI